MFFEDQVFFPGRQGYHRNEGQVIYFVVCIWVSSSRLFSFGKTTKKKTQFFPPVGFAAGRGPKKAKCWAVQGKGCLGKGRSGRRERARERETERAGERARESESEREREHEREREQERERERERASERERD